MDMRFGWLTRRESASTEDSLRALLDTFETASGDEDRVDAFERLFAWIRRPLRREHGADTSGASLTRLRAFLTILEHDRQERSEFLTAFGTLLRRIDATALFGEAGMPSDRGAAAEFADRLLRRILPVPRDTGDGVRLFVELFSSEAHAERLRTLPADFFQRLVELLRSEDGALWDPIRDAFANGTRLLAMRLMSQGLAPRIRARGSGGSVTDSPFVRAAEAATTILDHWYAGNEGPADLAAWLSALGAARAEMQRVHDRLDSEGVNVDIVFGLEVLERALHRLDLMIAIMTAGDAAARSAAIHHLLVLLADVTRQDRGIIHLLRWTLRLLNRKIVERAGRSGEHYIASSQSEYGHIWLAAAGGGLLTTATAAGKLWITTLGLPLFQEGLAAGINYAVSFLLLQRFGLMLATKQPAMTAASLAAIMRERHGSEQGEELVTYTARIAHSQLAAATANVVVVSIGAFAVDLLWRVLTGHGFLAGEEARAVFTTLSPLTSGTVFYAALTGVLLWLGSVSGGWFDNFSVYHRLPQGIAEHPFGRVFGRARLERIAASFRRNAGGWATNIALGMLLGLTPAFGYFFGLPFDVRHVTLSTGMLAFGVAQMSHGEVQTGWMLEGIAGIAVMFVLNLSVSFLLALFNASSAYGMPGGGVRDLLRRLFRRFFRHPLQFLLPVGTYGKDAVRKEAA